jgi:hypothetical protein
MNGAYVKTSYTTEHFPNSHASFFDSIILNDIYKSVVSVRSDDYERRKKVQGKELEK